MIRGTVNSRSMRWSVDTLEWIPDTGALAPVIGEVVIGTVKQGTGGASPWLISPPAAKTANASGSLNGVNQAVTLTVTGYTAVAVQIEPSGTLGTFAFEGTVDGTNWVRHPLSSNTNPLGAAASSSFSSTGYSGGLYFGGVSGLTSFRVRDETGAGATQVTIQAIASAALPSVQSQIVGTGNFADSAADVDTGEPDPTAPGLIVRQVGMGNPFLLTDGQSTGQSMTSIATFGMSYNQDTDQWDRQRLQSAGELTAGSGTATSSGDTVIATPAAGKRIRLYYVSYNPSNAVTVGFKFGSGSLFLKNNITTGGSIVAKDFGDFRYVQGAVDETLSINLSGAVSTHWNVFYVEI